MADLQFLVPPKVPSLSADPASPSAGDIYFNTSTNKLRVYNGSTWDEWSSVSTPVSVANGGTSATTLTSNNVLLGNGTGAVQFVAPGTSGNVLTSNGTTWQSTAPSGGTPYAVTYSTDFSDLASANQVPLIGSGYTLVNPSQCIYPAKMFVSSTSGSYVVVTRQGAYSSAYNIAARNAIWSCYASIANNAADVDAFIGMSDSGVSATAAGVTVAGNSIGFLFQKRSGGVTAYAVTCKAGTSTQTSFSFSMNNEDDVFAFKVTGTSRVEFYVSGTLVATNTTNVPLSVTPQGSSIYGGAFVSAMSNRNTTGSLAIYLYSITLMQGLY